MNRNRTIDMLKGIGIFLVVLGHSTFVDDRIITYVFSFHMPLFFVVSGLLMALTNESASDFKPFITKKLRSMAIPYLCFSVCYTIIDAFSVYYHQISFNDLKVNAVCTLSFAGSGPLWFIPTLMLSEIILYFLIKRFTRLQVLILGIIISAIGFSATGIFLPFFEAHKISFVSLYFMNFVVVILRGMICQIFLVPGYLLHRYAQKLKSSLSPVELIAGILLMIANYPLALRNTNPDLHNLNYGNVFLFITCSYLGTLGLYLICKNLPKIKLIEFWGQNSLIIMVTHLNFYLLYIGNIFAHAVNPYITRAKSYIFLFNILWVTMLLASILILLINRFLPWMAGKKKKS